MELKPTEFKPGVDVVTAEGDQIGTLDRVVVDPRTEKITDIVIKKGGLLSTDKVIPADSVQSATEDRIILLPDVNLEILPDFETSYFVPARQPNSPANVTTTDMMAIYWNPPLSSTPGYPMFPDMYGQTATVRNIPEGTVALKEGAKVYNADGQHIGDVTQILYDPENKQITHMVVEHGLLTKEKKLIPANWIMKIQADRVDLAVGSRVLDQLKAYQE